MEARIKEAREVLTSFCKPQHAVGRRKLVLCTDRGPICQGHAVDWFVKKRSQQDKKNNPILKKQNRIDIRMDCFWDVLGSRRNFTPRQDDGRNRTVAHGTFGTEGGVKATRAGMTRSEKPNIAISRGQKGKRKYLWQESLENI